MIEDRLLPEEDLVLSAAPLPAVSRSLRRRTLQAAVQAQGARAATRRQVKTACLLFAALLLAAWTGAPWGLSPGNPHQVAAAQTSGPAAVPLSLKDRMRAAQTGDDWQLVEATVRAREMGSLVLRCAF
jgi:hypothetical protein